MSENLFMTPLREPFELDRIKAYLNCQPDIFEDPIISGTYLLCGLPGSVATYYRNRLSRPETFPYVTTIRIAPECVQLDQTYASHDQLRSALDFARWFKSKFEWTIADEYGRDLTERVRGLGVDSLYPDNIVTSELPWAGSLIEVGDFDDLEQGNPFEFSLMELPPTPYDNLERLVAYLQSGHIVRRTSTVVFDQIDDGMDLVEIGILHWLGDDMYAWRSDLSHYIAKYQLRLPPSFLCHVQNNNYRIPAASECKREFKTRDPE